MTNVTEGSAMKIGAPTEIFEGEARVAMTPASAALLQKLGYECIIQSGAGAAARGGAPHQPAARS